MINLILKRIQKKPLGAITLVLTVILLVMATLIVLVSAEFSSLQQKSVANDMRNAQAFEAAEAGLEFAMVYFQKNSATIIGSPPAGMMSGYTDSNITNVSLANGSLFSIYYTNLIPYNYKLIQISVTGVNADGTATRTINQQIAAGMEFSDVPQASLTSKSSITMKNSSNITNNQGNNTILSGSTVSLQNAATTTTLLGGSSAAYTGPDIQANLSSLSGMTNSQFLGQYFSVSQNALKASVNYYFTSNYSSADGLTGASIWIDQAASFANAVIGSSSNPVLMIVNGNLDLSQNTSIFGFVYVLGSLTASNSATITGAVAATNTISMSNNAQFIYSSSVLNTVQQLSSLNFYAKVPGSWKDF